jgi:hypothetical protein
LDGFLPRRGCQDSARGFNPGETSDETVRPKRAQALTWINPTHIARQNEFGSIFAGENDVHQDKSERLAGTTDPKKAPESKFCFYQDSH